MPEGSERRSAASATRSGAPLGRAWMTICKNDHVESATYFALVGSQRCGTNFFRISEFSKMADTV